MGTNIPNRVGGCGGSTCYEDSFTAETEFLLTKSFSLTGPQGIQDLLVQESLESWELGSYYTRDERREAYPTHGQRLHGRTSCGSLLVLCN